MATLKGTRAQRSSAAGPRVIVAAAMAMTATAATEKIIAAGLATRGATPRRRAAAGSIVADATLADDNLQ
jgi:hypothetical protein